MAQFDTLSTAGLAPHRRIEYWNDIACDSATPSTWDADDRPRFSGRMTRAQIEEFRFADVSVSPSVVRHSGAHVARTRQALFSLKMQVEGRSVTRQDGRTALLNPGDFTLCDSTRSYELICDVSNRMLILGIPAPLLRRHVACPEAAIAIAMPGHEGTSGLLSGFLRDFWNRFPQGVDATVAPHITQVVLNLIASAYATLPRTQADRTSLTAVRRLRIAQYIERHLSDPELTPAKIAAACRIKPRYLHKLYAGGDETVARFILRRRLEECARALSSDLLRGRTVTEIAFDHGFNSPTHFGRVFRERYGMTPSEYRLGRVV